MTLLTLDTSFVIDFLSGVPAAVEKLRRVETDGDTLAVASVVVYELLVLSSGDREPQKVQKAISTVEAVLSRIGLIWSLDPAAARLAAEIQRAQMSRGRPVSVRDLFIAATSLVNGCNTVITRNVRDFEVIDGLRVETY